MMSDVDAILRDLFMANNFDPYDDIGAEIVAEASAKIKQAFIEEGWILLPKNFVCSSHHWKDGNHVPILSGAEWYQRFEKARTGKTFYYYPDDAMKTMREADIFYMNAAKKASNL